jgi:DNA-binding transcriptional MerR regulator
MNSHMQIDQISRQLGFSEETIRSYAERFALYVPVVRSGAEFHYPPEGVQLLGEIAEGVEAGASLDEIEAALQAHVPVTIVAFPAPEVETRPAPTIEDVLQSLAEQRDAIAAHLAGLTMAIERLATADQFHGLRAETASLAAALALRDTQLEHANSLIVAELREALGELRQEIADLHADRRDEFLPETPMVESPVVESTVIEAPLPETTPERLPSRVVAAPERNGNGRTPRRMGQPLRLNGLPQN